MFVDVNLERFVVLTDNKAVTDGIKVYTQRLEIDGLVLLRTI